MTSGGTDWFTRYKFCQPLGQGGMGTVYLAEDRTHDNVQCVIKQLTNKYTDPVEHAEAVRLFQREAAILRSLDHPGIVRVFDDYATEDGRYFLVMDYVPGKNLEVMLNTGGPFSNDMVAQIGIQCCEVLAYLHSQEPAILYRDLKPSNLMLTPDGRIIFIDFGIARLFAPKEAATRVVTAGYSPPEQYFGKPEIRSDLYALGATLSHLATGKRPKPLNVSAPGLLNPKVLPSLDALCRKLTAHNPEDRPPSARAVRNELYRICREIYPDFPIPDEAMEDQPLAPSQDAAPAPLGSAFVRARAGVYSQPQPTNVAAEAPPDRVSRSSLRRVPPDKPPSLWQRVKQWFQIWMS